MYLQDQDSHSNSKMKLLPSISYFTPITLVQPPPSLMGTVVCWWSWPCPQSIPHHCWVIHWNQKSHLVPLLKKYMNASLSGWSLTTPHGASWPHNHSSQFQSHTQHWALSTGSLHMLFPLAGPGKPWLVLSHPSGLNLSIIASKRPSWALCVCGYI